MTSAPGSARVSHTAVVRLEFDSAPGDPMPPQVVTDVGNQQEIAVRTGLAG
jgi:hypothetical protein